MIWLVDILSEMTEILWGLFWALLKSMLLEEKRLFRSCFFILIKFSKMQISIDNQDDLEDGCDSLNASAYT